MPSERVEKSLRDILEAIALMRQWVTEAGGVENVFADKLVRSAIERQLLIVSEASIRIEHAELGFGPKYAPEIDWAGARGIGNAIRHRYDDIDREVVRHVLSTELDPLEAACHRLLALGRFKA